MGLQKCPKLDVILQLAAPPTDLKIREMALRYFIDNLDENYRDQYKPENVNIAFLPCSEPNTYAKPSECFVSHKCKIMKFQTLHNNLHCYAKKLGILQRPNGKLLVKRLIENPPQYEDEAKEVFECMASYYQ